MYLYHSDYHSHLGFYFYDELANVTYDFISKFENLCQAWKPWIVF